MKTISGYTTTYNCFEMEYPVEECIKSLLGFCDDVVVVDAGSKDGTIEALQRLSQQDSRVRYFVEPVDFNHPRWAIYQDGYLKAKARAHCQADFCWQTDTDEIVAPEEFARIRRLPEVMGDMPLIMLPMIEFWGSLDYVRADFLSWKPRFSINDKRITHGIPKELKCYDAQGHEYPRPFDSDTCNYIYRDTQEGVRIVVPIPPERGDLSRMTPSQWEACYFKNLDEFPHVFHLSWLDLKRKIRHYKKHWVPFHASMYNLATADTAENNVMFNKRWSEVSESDMEQKAIELKTLGPRFFHKKMNNSTKGLVFRFNRKIPELLTRWVYSKGFGVEKVTTAVQETSLDLWSNPRVSVVIAVKGNSAQLGETLESVMRQEYQNIETLIVNDGGSENLSPLIEQIARSFPTRVIKLIAKPRGGWYDAYNFGIRDAQGRFVMVLRAGDVLLPEFVRRGVEELQQSNARGFAAQLKSRDNRPRAWNTGHFDALALRYEEILPPILMVERDVWDKVGGFKTALPLAGEWDFWLGMTRADMKIACCPEELGYRGAEDQNSAMRSIPHALVRILNQDLFPVHEVITAHGEMSKLGQALLSEASQISAEFPLEWLPRFARALALEGTNNKGEALQVYLELIRLTGEKNWQPIYRAGLVALEYGKAKEAAEFFSVVRLLRPDMGPTVQALTAQRPAVQV